MKVPAWQPLAESIAVVVLIAGAQIALFLALPGDGSFDLATLNRAGAVGVGNAWSEPWRLLSTVWLHADWSHLLGNLIMLFMMSILLTRALGFDRFLLLYLGAGLASSLTSVVFERPDSLVGASGAIFGLTGATVAYAISPRRVLHESEVQAVREALFPIVLLQLLLSFMPGVSWGGHFGGFVFGAFVAGSGLLDVGLPERSAGTTIHPVRWGWVLGATLVVLVASCCSGGLADLVIMGFYAFILTMLNHGGPDWRPDMYPGVLLASLGALAVHALAVGLALWIGQPWDLDGLPRGPMVDRVEVALPGGLGSVELPAVLEAERTQTEADGRSVTRFGDAERFPFGLEVAVGPEEEPLQAITRFLDGDASRSFFHGEWRATCPWLGWEDDEQSGLLVFTAEGSVEIRLLRLEPPSDPRWARSEDALVIELQSLTDCQGPAWTTGQLGLGLRAAALDDAASRALGNQLAATPDDHELRRIHAEVLLASGNCQGSLIDFETYRRELPDDARGWDGIARATLACGSAKEHIASAEEAAGRALALDPKLGSAWESSGEALIAQGRREEAEHAYRQAAALAPDAAERARLEDRATKAKSGFRVRDRIGD